MYPQNKILTRSAPPAPAEVDLDTAIEQLRQKFKVPRVLVQKMVNQESGGNTNALSPKGARGQFQVMPETLNGISRQTGKNLDINNPLDNAYAGLYLLNQNYNRFRSKAKSERHAWGMAVAGYHGNPDNVEKDLAAGGLGIPDQGDGLINTRDHVANIFEGTKPEDFATEGESPSIPPTIEQPPSSPYAGVTGGVGSTPPSPSVVRTRFGTTQPPAGVLRGATPQVLTRPLKTPKVTVSLGEGAEMAGPPKVIKFEADSANKIAEEEGIGVLGQGARAVRSHIARQDYSVSPHSPDLIGKPVTLNFKEPPTPDQVGDAYLEQQGMGDLAKKFRAETGASLANISGEIVPKQSGDGYTVTIRPRKDAIDAINAYSLGGMDALRSAVESQSTARRLIARDEQNALKEGEGFQQDVKRIGAEQFMAYTQLAQNVKDLATGQTPAEDKTALAIAEARENLPRPSTMAGKITAIPVEAAGAINRAGAVPGPLGFPLETFIENAQAGPEQAWKSAALTLPMLAAGRIAESVAPELSGVGRQAFHRGSQATAAGATAAATGGTPSEIAKEALVGGLFPVGERGAAKDVRTPEVQAREALGIQRSQTVPDVTSVIAARDAAVKPSPSPRGLRVQETLRNARPVDIPQVTTRPPTIPYPENLGVVGPTKPIEGVTEGAKLNRWQHRDFGLVTESSDQANVPRSKVRVLAQDGSTHLIQKPDGRGAGNQIAVLVRERPADAATLDARGEADRIAPFRVIDRRSTQGSVPDDAAPAIRPPEILTRTAKTSTNVDQYDNALQELRTVAAAPREETGTSRRDTSLPVLTRSNSEGAMRDRSFPRSAAAAGLPEARDLAYAVNTDVGAVDRANIRIANDGPDRVINELQRTTDVSKDDVVAGSILAHRLAEDGHLDRAVDVIDDLSRKLTQAGQSVQAASLISRLSPEGVLLAAQRRMPTGAKLPADKAESLVAQAKAVRESDARVVELENQIENMRAGLESADSGAKPTRLRRATTKIGTLEDRLSQLETDARARLKVRAEKSKAELAPMPRGQRGSGLNPVVVAYDIGDLAIIGASKLAKRGMSVARWTAEMADEFGNQHDLRELYKKSFQLYDEQRKQHLQESRIRSAKRSDPESGNVQAVINQKLDTQTASRKARTELIRTFNSLNRTPLQRAGRAVMDVTGLTRALTTTADLSAGLRQGKIGLARHPVIWLDAFQKQFKALNTQQYERMISEMQSDPDFKYTGRFGLDLTTISSSENSALYAKEEAFQSGLVQRIPIVKHSEQAYNTMLDQLRMGWFKDYMGKLRNLGLDPENPADRPAFEEGASLINNATGRGNLGRRLTTASPVLSQIFFSPRFWASRMRLLTLPVDPRTYTTMSQPARVEAFKTLFSFYAVVGTQLALAKASGAQVDTDPDSADFLKAKWGPLHVDFSAGMQGQLRFAARIAKAVYQREQGRKTNNEPMDILARYARGKESPNVSLIHDLFLSRKEKQGYGTDYKGDPTSLLGKRGERIETSALVQRLTPMVIQDALGGYRQQGWSGVAKVAPLTVLGEGVSMYEPKKIRGATPSASVRTPAIR